MWVGSGDTQAERVCDLKPALMSDLIRDSTPGGVRVHVCLCDVRACV